jgi:fluoride exporter
VNPYVLIGLGGIAGANTRFFVSSLGVRRYGLEFPIGTLAINITGSAVMGFLLTFLNHRFGGGSNASLLLTTGFLGAYTTFSTFAYEAIALLKRNRHWPLTVYLGASVLGGAAGAALGIAIATLIDRRW